MCHVTFYKLCLEGKKNAPKKFFFVCYIFILFLWKKKSFDKYAFIKTENEQTINSISSYISYEPDINYRIISIKPNIDKFDPKLPFKYENNKWSINAENDVIDEEKLVEIANTSLIPILIQAFISTTLDKSVLDILISSAFTFTQIMYNEFKNVIILPTNKQIYRLFYIPFYREKNAYYSLNQVGFKNNYAEFSHTKLDKNFYNDLAIDLAKVSAKEMIKKNDNQKPLANSYFVGAIANLELHETASYLNFEFILGLRPQTTPLIKDTPEVKLERFVIPGNEITKPDEKPHAFIQIKIPLNSSIKLKKLAPLEEIIEKAEIQILFGALGSFDAVEGKFIPNNTPEKRRLSTPRIEGKLKNKMVSDVNFNFYNMQFYTKTKQVDNLDIYVNVGFGKYLYGDFNDPKVDNNFQHEINNTLNKLFNKSDLISIIENNLFGANKK